LSTNIPLIFGNKIETCIVAALARSDFAARSHDSGVTLKQAL
jgi:hypothetical protein